MAAVDALIGYERLVGGVNKLLLGGWAREAIGCLRRSRWAAPIVIGALLASAVLAASSAMLDIDLLLSLVACFFCC